MTAHEHHPQLVVFDSRDLGRVPGEAPFELPLKLRRPCAKRRVPPQHVERAIARDAKQPAAGVLRHAGVRPLLQRLEQRFLHDLFRQLEVRRTENAREPGNQLSRVTAEQMVDQLV